jgi:2-hydroxymuconate-semialdehyde hydrolase
MVDGEHAYSSLVPPPRRRWAEALELSPAALASIEAPVLLVHGAQDRLTPLASTALPLLDHLRDVRLHVLGACGHAPFVEHRAESLRVVLPFLSRTA